VCVFQVVLYEAAGLKLMKMVGHKAIATLLQQDPTPTFDYYVSDANVAPMDVSFFFGILRVVFEGSPVATSYNFYISGANVSQMLVFLFSSLSFPI